MLKTAQEIYNMDNKFIKLTSLKNTLNILGLFCYVICFGQITPNLEGQYSFKKNQAGVYIYDKNKFLVVGYETAVKGIVEIINNELEFKPDHPHSEFLLYGRKTTGNKQIIFEENLFRYKTFLGTSLQKKDELLLNSLNIERNDYCVSHQYFLPLLEIPNSIFLKTDRSDKSLTYFLTDKKYDEFIPLYMKEDTDISFLNGQIKIEKGILVYDETILKQDLNLKGGMDITEIKEIIGNIENVDSVFEQDYLYLNSDYNIVSPNDVNLNDYSYNKTTNQYISRKKSHKDLTILYKFNKIKSTENSVENVKFDDTNSLKVKCLRTPYTILKERNDEEYRRTNPQKTVEVKPQEILEL